MNNKIYFLSIIGIFSLIMPSFISAQCAGNRYHDYIFPTVPTPTSNIVYGSNIKSNNAVQSLMLDVYQPVGDVATSRPLVIIAHGGSFVGGSKTGTDVVPLAKDLARMGYVTASMEYRVGMTNLPFSDSNDAGAAVMRAVHDGRAAVRFFRKNAAIGGNTYKIDTNNIFMLGVSAGGFIALHVAYMDQLSEFPPYIDTTGTATSLGSAQYGMHGGLEGVSGNPGYSSSVKAVVNICGAIGDTAWIQPGDEPLLSFHGTIDGTVPYGYAYIHPFGPNIIKVYGSSVIAPRMNNLGIENCFETWEGQDHVPEVGTSASAVAHYDSTITITRNFLEHLVCGTALNCSYTTAPAVGISELTADSYFNVYPNPSNSDITLDLSAFNNTPVQIEMVDILGRVVRNYESIKNSSFTINRDNIPCGMYMMNVISDGQRFSKKIIFQ